MQVENKTSNFHIWVKGISYEEQLKRTRQCLYCLLEAYENRLLTKGGIKEKNALIKSLPDAPQFNSDEARIIFLEGNVCPEKEKLDRLKISKYVM